MLDLQQIALHSLDQRQFFDFRLSVLPNGMRIIDAYNASGLTFTLLPDRGLDIWTAHYRGFPLTWIAPGSPFPPDLGQPWLEQFNGGLMTTCGLAHVGPGETDEQTHEFRDLHGRFNRLRAQDVAIVRSDQELTLHGTIYEQRLFGAQLRLERSYVLPLNRPEIRLTDTVTNLTDIPAPLMLLYHINMGFPLVSTGAVLYTAQQRVFPRTDGARDGFDRWPFYDAPQVARPEQVFFHRVMHNAAGRSQALLQNGSLGFQIDWDTQSLPYLTQWKNTRQGMYVSGIEPGNCIPEGQIAARRNQRLVLLDPGMRLTTDCRITVLDGVDALENSKRQIEELRQHGTPTPIHLDDYA